MTVRILRGDCRELLKTLPDESVHCVVTSPPYYGLRDYGVPGQLGLERTLDEYLANMVEVFREVRRVLRRDGTLWLNIGDSYATFAGGVGERPGGGKQGESWKMRGKMTPPNRMPQAGYKPKDLMGVPWKLATALQQPYYTGRIKSEADCAWLAGFLDGEGTISFVERDRGPEHTSTHDVAVYLTNCDRVPLDRFSGVSGGRVYLHDDGTRENRFGTRPVFRWKLGTYDSALLIRELYPYLRTKRKQAALVWSLFTTLRHQNGHARTPGDVVERRKAIADLIRAANRGEAIDLPSWVEEPPPCLEPGWWLRSEIIWAKKSCMPESVRDRPTKSHEQIFLLAKSESYFYDSAAASEPSCDPAGSAKRYESNFGGAKADDRIAQGLVTTPSGKREFDGMRNWRDVWSLGPEPFKEAHFATFPSEIPRRAITAGCPHGGTVLDPFLGSGTTGLVADQLQRHCIGIELNQDYANMAERRIRGAAPLFAEIA